MEQTTVNERVENIVEIDIENAHIVIPESELSTIKAAMRDMGDSFRKWKNLEPVFSSYEWCGVTAFQRPKSPERKLLHAFLKVNSNAWEKAMQLETKLATMSNEQDIEKTKRLMDALRKDASTLASVALGRMSRYHNERMGNAPKETEPKESKVKSVKAEAQAFITFLEKVIKKPSADLKEKKLATMLIDAVSETLERDIPRGIMRKDGTLYKPSKDRNADDVLVTKYREALSQLESVTKQMQEPALH